MKKKKNDFVHVSVVGNLIKCIVYSDEQATKVINNMTGPNTNCVFEGYEPWEEDTTILTFKVLDYDDIRPVQN
tara:strand:+ start:381 stop:599 length:219 start_codon:yes stop_codon:yes gene_type:complete